MPKASFNSDFDRLIVSWLVGHTVEDVERELVLRTLASRRGCRTRAARDLQISIRTLRNKINQYEALGIDVASPGDRRSHFRPKCIVELTDEPAGAQHLPRA